jgi:hypothetical protein
VALEAMLGPELDTGAPAAAAAAVASLANAPY